MDTKIVVGDNLFEFNSDEIMSISSIEEQSLSGAELPIDTMTAVVRFNNEESESDLRLVHYGTPVSYYESSSLKGKFYIDTITRQSRYEYQLYCVSAIGLLDKKYHNGDIYFGTEAARLINDIVGNAAKSHVLEPFGSEKVYGWLPRDTSRNNLQQLLFALNGKVYCGSNGDLYFDYQSDTISNTEYTINDDDIYDQGEEEYPKQASKCTITEHSFYYNASVDPVLLFDNSSASNANAQWVNFDNAPVNTTTLTVDGDISILLSSANGAVITGCGKIYGKPYIHSTYEVSKTSGIENDYEVTVKDATLVSIANSENVADRILSYYTTGTKVLAGIVYRNEKCGRKYTLKDAFSDTRTGYISKIEKTFSSFTKANCEIYSIGNLGKKGNNFSNFSVLTDSGSFTVPTGVTILRAILVGGGDGGESGTAGEDGDGNRGGKGGKGGRAGSGGKVNIVDLNVTPGQKISYYCGAGGSGGARCTSTETPNAGYVGASTTFGGYSSRSGLPTKSGIKVLFDSSNNVYAVPGYDGVDGGDGGNGTSAASENGGGVSYRYTRSDGAEMSGNFDGAHAGNTISVADYDRSVTIFGDCMIGGGGGGGSSATGNGTVGGNGAFTTSGTVGYGVLVDVYGIAGRGGSGSTPLDAAIGYAYGCGGNGGHGGGGGGGHGQCVSNLYYISDTPQSDRTYNTGHILKEQMTYAGNGGQGGAGGRGQKGCIIVYY